MESKLITGAERRAQLRHWARGPYRIVDLAPTSAKLDLKGSGVARLPDRGVQSAKVVTGSGGTNYNSSCDAPASTTVSFGSGNVLGHADVLLIFWGSAWTNTSLSPGVGDISAAISQLEVPSVNSYGTYSYFDGLSPYGQGDYITWGFDVVAPPVIVSSNPPANPFSVATVSNLAQQVYNSPTAVENVLWNLVMVFMPPGYAPSGQQGEHSYFTDSFGHQINFGYVSYSPTLSNITFVFSHELVESLTDPHGDAVQVNPRNASTWNEICDVCCSPGIYNGVTVTSYFSTAQNACMIPSPPPPPLVAGDYQIDSVRKVAGGRYIEMVSGPGNGQGRWALQEREVVSMIQQNQATFYTDVDDVRANVEVVRWYLETVADGLAPNNLDNLPEF
jgi:Protein of unknown function (DUF3892)